MATLHQFPPVKSNDGLLLCYHLDSDGSFARWAGDIGFEGGGISPWVLSCSGNLINLYSATLAQIERVQSTWPSMLIAADMDGGVPREGDDVPSLMGRVAAEYASASRWEPFGCKQGRYARYVICDTGNMSSVVVVEDRFSRLWSTRPAGCFTEIGEQTSPCPVE